MKNITIDLTKFNTEWATFWSNLSSIGLSDRFNEDDLREKMRTASGALSVDTGVAYEGGLLCHINLLTSIATRLAKMVCGTFPNVTNESLIKVCLLQHLSKIEMYEPNDNQWEIDKRGMVFKFSETEGCLKFGERSALNALNLGIHLTPTEFEAICCLDKDGEEAKNRKYVVSILSTIVRQANELAYAIERERFNKLNEE